MYSMPTYSVWTVPKTASSKTLPSQKLLNGADNHIKKTDQQQLAPHLFAELHSTYHLSACKYLLSNTYFLQDLVVMLLSYCVVGISLLNIGMQKTYLQLHQGSYLLLTVLHNSDTIPRYKYA